MPFAPLMQAGKFLGVIAVALTAALGLVAFIPLAEAVGFQQVSVPDAVDRPVSVGIWYPSASPVLQRPLELYSQEVAPDGVVSGDRLPLIVMSHGTGESFSAHYDTAIALAAAGFVVAAVTHTGDNYGDRSYAFTLRNFAGRARHIRQVIAPVRFAASNGCNPKPTYVPLESGESKHSRRRTSLTSTVYEIVNGLPQKQH
jgi:predicted dienelactone hydrolase